MPTGQIHDNVAPGAYLTIMSDTTLDIPPTRSVALARAIAPSSDTYAATEAGVDSFVLNLSAQKKEDVLDSILLSSLAASNRFDRFREIEQWFTYYTWLLQNFGWVSTGYKNDSRSYTENTPMTPEQLIMKYMADNVAPGQVALLQDTVIESLQSEIGPQGRGPVSLFLSSSPGGRDKQASFQLGPCVEDVDNDSVSFSFGAFYYDLQAETNALHTLPTYFSGLATFMSGKYMLI
ncbi:hypothetical protein BDN70DRAFT_935256 [Pholiota conissans]|uniref:Uncharacterized protein n=1 Tax=Pholiota conissans TaxID=109636 RepID=A0A9P5YYH5_9AGAR|nr:hypothetical protein BDN70DRAFT_935256 [Pholiota conissans]